MNRRPARFSLAPLAGLLLGLIAVSGLRAQGGPPFITDDPGTPGAGHWEINFAWTHDRRSGQCESELPLLDMNYGVSERVQVSYTVAQVVCHDDGTSLRVGRGNSITGVKWRFLDDAKAGVSMSVSLQFEFRNPGSNSPARGLSADENAAVLPVEFQREAGGWCYTAEVGAVRPSQSDPGWFYGVILGHAVGERVGCGLELHGESDERLSRTLFAVNLGARVKLSENFNLLVSVGRELHNGLDSRATLMSYVGLQWTR